MTDRVSLKTLAKMIDHSLQQPNGFYAYPGATDHHLRLMRAHCPPSVEIKAAGGVRTLGDLLRVREFSENLSLNYF